MKLSKEERETGILGNAASREWSIMTADPRIIRKLKKRGYEGKALGAGPYIGFVLPFTCVSFRSKPKPKIDSDSKPHGQTGGFQKTKPKTHSQV